MAGAPREVTLGNPLVAGTAGALISDVPDMTRYASKLASEAGLAPDTARMRQTWTPLSSTGVRLQYGLGIGRIGDWVGHNGSTLGYSDMVFYLPARQATVVVMVNTGANTATKLWDDIVKQLYPDSLPRWQPTVAALARSSARDLRTLPLPGPWLAIPRDAAFI